LLRRRRSWALAALRAILRRTLQRQRGIIRALRQVV